MKLPAAPLPTRPEPADRPPAPRLPYRGPHRWTGETARFAGRRGGQTTSLRKARAKLPAAPLPEHRRG